MERRGFTTVEFNYRRMCQIIAIIDALWWTAEFTGILVKIVGSRLGYVVLEPYDDEKNYHPDVIRFTFIGPLGWSMIMPLLQFLYIVAVCLNVGVSCILWKACQGEAALEYEEGACNMWSKLVELSIVVLGLLYFFPYTIISIGHVLYMGVRIVFLIIGLILVNCFHGRQLRKAKAAAAASLYHIPDINF